MVGIKAKFTLQMSCFALPDVAKQILSECYMSRPSVYNRFVMSLTCCIFARLFNVSPASTSVLPLAIEEHCSDRRSKIVERGKISRVKIWSPSWCINSLLDGLAEEHKDKAMYSSSWLWAFITDNFISCNKVYANMSRFVNMNAAHICRNMSQKL
jgi:hypothetical protein